jgi:hypothetical protein
MAISKRSGLGGFNNQIGVGGSVGAVGETELEEGTLPELQGNLREDPKAPSGADGDDLDDDDEESTDAQRVGSARVGDEEDLDQGLDRLDNGDLDDDEQRIDPALDADIQGGE